LEVEEEIRGFLLLISSLLIRFSFDFLASVLPVLFETSLVSDFFLFLISITLEVVEIFLFLSIDILLEIVEVFLLLGSILVILVLFLLWIIVISS